MSFRTPIDCSIEQIDLLERQFNDELGQAFNGIMNKLAQAEPAIEALNLSDDIGKGNQILQDLLNLGDGSGVTQLSDVPSLFGIDAPASQSYDEELIFNTTGMVMTSGVLFKGADPGTDSEDNIEVLRRAYNAAGRDIDLAANILTGGTDNGYRFRMQFRKYPAAGPNKALTLSELRAQSGIRQLQSSDYVVLSDKSTLVIYRDPLVTPDITAREVPVRYRLDVDELTSCIIQKGTAKNNTNAINNWINQGYNTELPYILDGVDPSSNPDLLVEPFASYKGQLGSLIKDLEFIRSRLIASTGTRTTIKPDRFVAAARQIERSIKKMIGLSLFQVVIVKETDVVAKLRVKLSDKEIRHLLEDQVYVKGINFSATDAELSTMVYRAASITAGDATISSITLNSTPTVAQTNYATLLLSMSDVTSALALIQEFTANSLKSAISVLNGMMDRTLVNKVPDPAPVAGFTCMVTPNTAMMSRLNFDRSFKISLGLGKIDEIVGKFKDFYQKSIADNLTKLFKIIVSSARKAIQMVNQVRDSLLAKILPLKRQLEEFIAKYLTFVGKGDFDSSLLKCAVNFNLGLGSSVLDLLETLIQNIVKKINQLIGLLSEILLDTITNLLCPILAWIEKMLGAGNSYLPSFCAINAPVLLPPEAVQALGELRTLAALQSQTFGTYDADLVRMRALVTTAPDRLAQFRASSDCANTPANLMMQNAIVSVTQRITLPAGALPI